MAKIIGVTVGTTSPRPNWSQTNTRKSDFIKNKPEQDLPPVTAADNEKVLQVEDGKWKAKEIADANAIVSQHNQNEGAHPSLVSAIAKVKETVNNLDIEGKVDSGITAHNRDGTAHQGILEKLDDLETRLESFLESDDTTLDQVKEIVAYIKENRGLIESVTTDKVNVSAIADNLDTPLADHVLSANQGVVLANLIDDLTGRVGTLENAKPNLEGYVTTEQLESALGAYITDLDNLVGGGIEGATPALISFTVDGKEYQAEAAMTWGEWCASDYNTGGYTNDGIYANVYTSDGTSYVLWNGTNVTGATIIGGGYAYTHYIAPTLITFTIDGATYQAEEGMTWEQWCASEYNGNGWHIKDGSVPVDSTGNYQINNPDYPSDTHGVQSAYYVIDDTAYTTQPYGSAGGAG